MELDDWASRWEQGQTGWHQAKVNSILLKYETAAWGPDGPDRVFVPLCGKSLDMVHLAASATEVLGIE